MRRDRPEVRQDLLLAALSPAAFALVVERHGYGVGEAIMLGAGLVSFLAMEVMALGYRRRRRQRAQAHAVVSDPAPG